MVIVSISCVSAADIDDEGLLAADSDDAILADDNDNMATIDHGTVSGGVDVSTSSPWSTSGEFSYSVPGEADVKSANLYVNVYSGSAQPTHAAHADIKINNEDFASEDLISTEGSADGTVYTINDHTNKVYSDYELHYDITNTVKALNGTTIKFNVDTSAIEGKTFDGRIKWLALIVAYDDGDSDMINYWINAGQTYSKDTLSTSFETSSTDSKYSKATLKNVILSSVDAIYKFNNEILLGDAIESNTYYKYHEWDVSEFYKAGENAIVDYSAGQGTYGKSIKNTLAVLTLEEHPSANVASIKSEYNTASQGNVVYPGFENTITASISASEEGDYTVILYADGTSIANTTAHLTPTASNVLIVDPTIRTMDDSTWFDGENNPKVNYSINVYDGNVLIGSAETTAKVRFNGYFSKDESPDMSDMKFDYNTVITGDVLISNGDSVYASGTKNTTAVIPLALPENSTFAGGLLYLAYCYDSTGNEFLTFDNITFNDENIGDKIVGKYRDQPNLGSASRYGLLIYDVSDLVKDGDNILYTSRSASGAVYPATLIAFYNTTGSEALKQVSLLNGADTLTYSSYNVAKRPVNVTTSFDFDQTVVKAMWYVFGAGAQAGRGDLVFNEKTYTNVWSGNSYSSDMVDYDVTDLIKAKNTMSFVATGGIITALQQMFVIEYVSNDAISVDRAKGSTQADITASLPSDADGNITVYIDGEKSVESPLVNGSFSLKTSELASGTHAFSIVYSGDEKYPSITKNVTITVPKPVLKANNINMLYTAGTKYSVLVTLDGQAQAGKYVTISFNGATKQVKTDSKGYAYFAIPSSAKPKTAKYTITASYNGVKASNKVKISSIIKAKNLKVKKSAKKLTIKVTLKKVNKKYLKGKKLTLKFKGKKYTAKTNKKGIATFKITKKVLKKLKAGKKYAYKVSYNKDVVSKKITVKR